MSRFRITEVRSNHFEVHVVKLPKLPGPSIWILICTATTYWAAQDVVKALEEDKKHPLPGWMYAIIGFAAASLIISTAYWLL